MGLLFGMQLGKKGKCHSLALMLHLLFLLLLPCVRLTTFDWPFSFDFFFSFYSSIFVMKNAHAMSRTGHKPFSLYFLRFRRKTNTKTILKTKLAIYFVQWHFLVYFWIKCDVVPLWVHQNKKKREKMKHKMINFMRNGPFVGCQFSCSLNLFLRGKK